MEPLYQFIQLRLFPVCPRKYLYFAACIIFPETVNRFRKTAHELFLTAHIKIGEHLINVTVRFPVQFNIGLSRTITPKSFISESGVFLTSSFRSFAVFG